MNLKLHCVYVGGFIYDNGPAIDTKPMEYIRNSCDFRQRLYHTDFICRSIPFGFQFWSSTDATHTPVYAFCTSSVVNKILVSLNV